MTRVRRKIVATDVDAQNGSEQSVGILGLIERIAGLLQPGSTLIVKDIDTRPRLKMAYTYLMDKLMDKVMVLALTLCSPIYNLKNRHLKNNQVIQVC